MIERLSPGDETFIDARFGGGGQLEAVCARCFYLSEVSTLTQKLDSTDATRVLVEEHLRAVYELLRDRLNEKASEALAKRLQDAP